jgi:hypothetical protein
LEIVSGGGCYSEMNKKILVLEGQAYGLEKEGKIDEAKNLY